MKSIIFPLALVAALVVTSAAHAKREVQTTRTVYELSDFPELETKANAVCSGKLVMSDKLKAACAAKTFPSVTKAGAFRNSGIGAELNSLMRQDTAAK